MSANNKQAKMPKVSLENDGRQRPGARAGAAGGRQRPGAKARGGKGSKRTPSQTKAKGATATKTAPEEVVELPDPQVEIEVAGAGGAPARVLVHDAGAAQFAARLKKVARQRAKWAAREDVLCYRVYDADLPEYNAAIDIYEGVGPVNGQTFVHIAEYQAPAKVPPATAAARFADVVALTPAVLGVPADHVFCKVRQRARGGSQYSQAGSASFVTYTGEGPAAFEIDMGAYLDTGIFLDHRTTRFMVGKMARGARFLNLFAYTGTATVHAAFGGAAQTTTVDMSATYLDWARRNMARNGFSGPEHRFVKADCMAWLAAPERKSNAFDLVFVDPPTFSNSKSMGKRTWDVQRDHVQLLAGVACVLAPGGVAVFSCNLRNFKLDTAALAALGLDVQDITAQTIPEDFQRNPKIHKCFVVRRAGQV